MNVNELCKGCTIRPTGCQIQYIKKSVEVCPCINCLVKMMCRYMCTGREELYLSLPSSIKEKLTELYEQRRLFGLSSFDPDLVLACLEDLNDMATNLIEGY